MAPIAFPMDHNTNNNVTMRCVLADSDWWMCSDADHVSFKGLMGSDPTAGAVLCRSNPEAKSIFGVRTNCSNFTEMDGRPSFTPVAW